MQLHTKFYSDLISPKFIVLIESLKEANYIKSEDVETVMKSIDRADFAPENSYADSA